MMVTNGPYMILLTWTLNPTPLPSCSVIVKTINGLQLIVRLIGNTTYTEGHKLAVFNENGIVDFAEDAQIDNVPGEYSLSQNYPNPFNPITTIKYSIPKQSKKIFESEGVNF